MVQKDLLVTEKSGPGVSVFLCGDVMTGRGVDQILPHPGDPRLREPAVHNAGRYVALAERVNGPIPRPVDFAWPWGEALEVLDDIAPDVRLVNLETAITSDGAFAPGKAVHYRMHPDNIACVAALQPDVCVLANNHVLDFGTGGLGDTMKALDDAGIGYAGAGFDGEEAKRPAVTSIPGGGRIVTVAVGMKSSGIPSHWAAGVGRPGVAFVSELSKRTAAEIAERATALRRPADVAVVSLHWGPNWGYRIGANERRFAHRLVDAGVDIVFGHSSHHPRPIEVYRGKLILYGCGDIVNDYEGIGGYEFYRDDLRLLCFASTDPASGELTTLRIVTMRARKMRLERAARDEAEWVRSTLADISGDFGTCVESAADGIVTVRA